MLGARRITRVGNRAVMTVGKVTYTRHGPFRRQPSATYGMQPALATIKLQASTADTPAFGDERHGISAKASEPEPARDLRRLGLLTSSHRARGPAVGPALCSWQDLSAGPAV